MKVKLKDLGTIQTGNTPSKSVLDFYNSNDIGFVKPDMISDSQVNNIVESTEYLSESARCKARIAKENSVFVTCIGSIGKIGVTVGKEFAFNQQINAIEPNRNIIPKYLAYNLFANKKRLQAISNAPVVPIINKTQFGEFEIVITDNFKNQLRIVGILDKITEIINTRKKQMDMLDRLIKARFVEMFGDIVHNPFNWEKELLGMVCDVRDGTHDSPKYYETGYPLITSKNVTGGKINLTDCSLICETDFKKINERSKVDIGDIIMPMIGTVGKPVIVDVEPNFAIKNVSLIKFKVESRVINIFVHALLQSDYFDDAVLNKVRGGTQKFISLGDIRKFAIIVPPIELQEQFASFVKQVDKSKLAVQKSLEKTQQLFDSLMQEYFG